MEDDVATESDEETAVFVVDDDGEDAVRKGGEVTGVGGGLDREGGGLGLVNG